MVPIHSKRLTILGCGFLGAKLAEIATHSGWHVTGVRRSEVGGESVPGMTWVRADVADGRTLAGLPAADVIVYCVSPGGKTEESYRKAYVIGLGNVIAHVRKAGSAYPRIVLISSTGVYGQDGGEVVTERSETSPRDFTGKIILEGEELLRASGLPHTIMRLSGIYGPGRDYFIRMVCEGRVTFGERDEYTNRIHVEDASYAILHCASIGAAGEGIFVGSDPHPVLRSQFLSTLAEGVGAAIPTAAFTGSPANKRCMPSRLLASGFSFRYPDYRLGYRSVTSAH